MQPPALGTSPRARIPRMPPGSAVGGSAPLRPKAGRRFRSFVCVAEYRSRCYSSRQVSSPTLRGCFRRSTRPPSKTLCTTSDAGDAFREGVRKYATASRSHGEARDSPKCRSRLGHDDDGMSLACRSQNSHLSDWPSVTSRLPHKIHVSSIDSQCLRKFQRFVIVKKREKLLFLHTLITVI